MASIDALSAVDNKPRLSFNENDYITLKSVKEVATLEDQRFRELLQAVHSFVASHIDECMFIPRTLKKGPYTKLLELFLSNGGSQLWSSDRDGYQAGTHFLWPHDKEQIRFLAFVLIKLEAAKQCAKKRKESGPDDKETASAASSPPPPQAKKAKITEPPKKGLDNNIGSPERTGLFGRKTTTNGFQDTPRYDSDDDMEDSIVVEEKLIGRPAKKVTAGDPFTQVRDLHKPYMVDPDSPSPAPKPDRKLGAKPTVKESSGLKFDVSVPAPSQAGKQARKGADNTARVNETVTAPLPTKAVNAKVAAKQAGAKTQEEAKSAKQKMAVQQQGKVIQDYSEVAAPAQQDKEDIAMSGMTVNDLDGHYHEQNGYRSPDSTDMIHVFTPNADGLQATVEMDHVRIKPDLTDNATIAITNHPKHASSALANATVTPAAKGPKATIEHSKLHALGGGQNRPVGLHSKHAGIEMANEQNEFTDAEDVSSESQLSSTKGNEDLEEVANEEPKLSGTRTLTPGISLPRPSPIAENNGIATTVAAAPASLVAPTPRPHVFVVTVSQPEDPGADIDSICLTFSPTTTNWASFYCTLAMQLPVEDRVAFARAKTCKIRVPRHGQRKSRVFGFEIKPAAVETIWANVMRMVASLGDDSEPVEVEFFP